MAEREKAHTRLELRQDTGGRGLSEVLQASQVGRSTKQHSRGGGLTEATPCIEDETEEHHQQLETEQHRAWEEEKR